MKLFGSKIIKIPEGVKKVFKRVVDTLENFFAKKLIRIAVLALAFVGVIAIVLTTLWKQFVLTPPELPSPEPNQVISDPTFDMDVPVSSTPTPTPDDDPTPQQVTTDRKEGCYTVLLAGYTGNGDLNTDTLMVGMLDTVNKSLNIVSIPRDTMVNVKRNPKKINSAYAMGYRESKENGAQQLLTELKSILGFKPDYYAIVNMNGFVKMIDTMGGVTYNVPEDMYKNTGDMIINLKKGEKKLSGYEALQLVRYRGYKGNNGHARDDYGRMETQQDFLKAVAKQLVSVGNLFKINEFADIAKENLQTNLEVSDMLWFGNTLLSYGTDCMEFHTLPTTVGSLNGISYVYVNENEAVEMINETINPLYRDITEDDLDILIMRN